MRFKNLNYCFFIIFLTCLFQAACNKLVQIPQPINTVTTATTFSSDITASSAVAAIYSKLRTSRFSASGTTIYAGLSSDELATPNGPRDQFFSNRLTSSNAIPSSAFWTPAYQNIYMANAVIDGLQLSTTVDLATKNELIGEAKFLRAFCYFYLVNLFGDVPLALTTDFNQTALLYRAPVKQVYQQITNDLTSAKSLLISDYSLSNGERIRANKWAATALLARVYLYQQQWDSAKKQSSEIINSGMFRLLDNLNNVFLMDSAEAIWQLQTANANPWATIEGNNFIPFTSSSSPLYYLTSELMSAFESGDQRKLAWINSTLYAGTTYYYPYKYKVKSGSAQNITEYYMVLRFAEQFLIRAEAEVNLNDLGSAINDLDSIRTRAGLPHLSPTLTKEQVLSAVIQERRIELFAEWGNRWFDLKRTGQAVDVLSKISYKKGNINQNQLLYPIPLSEILIDQNLAQNPGY